MKNQKIQKCLRSLAAKHGGLLEPETVVEEARSKSSPLHSKFQWDNTLAAHQWRIWQARQLISVCVEVLGDNLDASPVFVSLSTDRGRKRGGYRVTAQVLSDAELREQMLADALCELNSFQHKYRMLRQLAEVFAAIRKVKKAA